MNGSQREAERQEYERQAREDAVKQPPSFDVYTGTDGTLVIHVDTKGLPEDERGPVIRVYLNDDVIYENPVWVSDPWKEDG